MGNLRKPIKRNRMNEYGGYDDPNMRARHSVGYMDSIKENYNTIIQSLQSLENLSPEILDDKLRKGLEKFLNDISPLLKTLGKEAIEAEKKNLDNSRGGRPTRRD
jgi:hypothetical protein